MKLLLDQNVSPRLAQRLADIFPDSAHVETLGLGTASGEAVWDFARSNQLTIVSKDGTLADIACYTDGLPSFCGSCWGIARQATSSKPYAPLVQQLPNSPQMPLRVY